MAAGDGHWLANVCWSARDQRAGASLGAEDLQCVHTPTDSSIKDFCQLSAQLIPESWVFGQDFLIWETIDSIRPCPRPSSFGFLRG